MCNITKKLIKYFLYIITLVITICFLGSSLFISRFYINQQYSQLESNANDIYSYLKNGVSPENIGINGILIKDDDAYLLGNNKMGVMPFLRHADYSNLLDKGTFKNPMGEEFLYYKLNTELGNIIVLQNKKTSHNYLKVVYIILLLVFIVALILSIPLISYLGKKFTFPILKLQKAADDISKDNFNIDVSVKTHDEIEDLSLSIEKMATKLKRKYALQRDFIANVSHDFKTPLSIIRNYSEAISDGIVDYDNAKQYSKEVISEVDRLNYLVMDILQLSKLQEGAYSLNKEFFMLDNFLKGCVDKFVNTASSKNITLSLYSIPSFIYGDVNALARVMYNFIQNAIKFSSNDSIIEISSTLCNNTIKVSVKDFGIGIEEHMLDDIWDKYYKHSKSGGMGLGLPICKEILELHQFQYGVNSNYKEGTEFYFIVPKNFTKHKIKPLESEQ